MQPLFRRLRFYLLFLAFTLTVLLTGLRPSRSQDWFSIGINLGAPKIKIAVADFPAGSADPKLASLTREFNRGSLERPQPVRYHSIWSARVTIL